MVESRKAVGLRRLGFSGPVSLQASGGRVGFWSRDSASPTHFVTLQPMQAALLLQFAPGPRRVADAVAAAGIDHDEQVNELIGELIRHGILIERPPPTACDVPVYRFYHPEIGEDDPVCMTERDACDPSTVESIISGMEQSKLLGSNVLSSGFSGTRGFAVKFRREAAGQLSEWLPWLRPFLDRVLAESVAQYFGGGARAEPERVNACYLNALVLPPGTGTGLHIDCTLDGRTSASWVSVLYLRTVEPPVGRLVLHKGPWPVALVNPRPGMMVHFRGDLSHGVSDTRATDPERMSLVCEQYALPPPVLRRCSYIEVIRAG